MTIYAISHFVPVSSNKEEKPESLNYISRISQVVEQSSIEFEECFYYDINDK